MDTRSGGTTARGTLLAMVIPVPGREGRSDSPRRPTLEGSVAVRDGRRLSFAEYGSPRGPALVWMHGTPGARRQIPIPFSQ